MLFDLRPTLSDTSMWYPVAALIEWEMPIVAVDHASGLINSDRSWEWTNIEWGKNKAKKLLQPSKSMFWFTLSTIGTELLWQLHLLVSYQQVGGNVLGEYKWPDVAHDYSAETVTVRRGQSIMSPFSANLQRWSRCKMHWCFDLFKPDATSTATMGISHSINAATGYHMLVSEGSVANQKAIRLLSKLNYWRILFRYHWNKIELSGAFSEEPF